jgi:hypothetical protein
LSLPRVVIDLRQPLPPLIGARTVSLGAAARLLGCSKRTLRNAGARGELTLIRRNQRVVVVALVDVAAFYAKNSRIYSTTTTKRVGRPWGARKLTT